MDRIENNNDLREGRSAQMSDADAIPAESDRMSRKNSGDRIAGIIASVWERSRSSIGSKEIDLSVLSRD
jgi:hypothetical protein